MSLVVGVVVEGKDDFEVIEAAVTAEFVTLGLETPGFRRLQPEEDATGSVKSGGWAKVLGWLKKYSGEGIETFFTPLFANAPACDLIVIHLDADIYEPCLNHMQLPLPENPGSVTALVASVTAALEKAVSVSSERRKLSQYRSTRSRTGSWQPKADAQMMLGLGSMQRRPFGNSLRLDSMPR